MNLLKILPQCVCTIQKIVVFALKLLFFEIFRRGKISQKIRMKRKLELQKNAFKLNAISMFLDEKLCKLFLIFLKFRLF